MNIMARQTTNNEQFGQMGCGRLGDKTSRRQTTGRQTTCATDVWATGVV